MTGIAGLRVLLAPNPSPMTLDGTRTFLVGTERPVVIDPGPADERHLAALAAALAGASPAAILLTHAHPDHAEGAGQLARRTGAPVMMAPGALDAVAAAIPVDRWLTDGEEIATDAGPVRAIATPGHTPEHAAFFWHGPAAPRGGALFVGDLMMGEGDTTLIAPPEGDLATYLASLDRVQELAPAILFPTHGPPIRDPAAAIERYREHRRQRTEQVAAALRKAGDATPAELVRSIYGPELHPQLRGAAAGSVEAMLRYLLAVGRVRTVQGERYALVNPRDAFPGHAGGDPAGALKDQTQTLRS